MSNVKRLPHCSLTDAVVHRAAMAGGHPLKNLSVLLWMIVAGACTSPGVAVDDAGQPVVDAAVPMDAGGPSPDAARPPPDAGAPDAATSADAAVTPDASVITPDGGACVVQRETFACTADPETCRGGICVSGQCLGPQADPDRWVDCGDGTCSACEDATRCPADCAAPPAVADTKVYDQPATTMTVELHGFGFNRTSSFEQMVYGQVLETGELGPSMMRYGVTLPNGFLQPTAPNQYVAVEYYGATPAAWMTTSDVAAVEVLDWRTHEGLERYATVVALFIRNRMALSGATHVNILCHSMGCHVMRWLMEHDVAQLASDSVVVRVTTVAGAVNGAGLARWYENDVVRQYAGMITLNTADFIHCNPDYVADASAVWDHKLTQANNPLWRGVLMHQLTATNPQLHPLDIINPADEANDSVLFAPDMFFTAQAQHARFVALDGTALAPSHTYLHVGHTAAQGERGTGLLAAASLFHHRRVTITLGTVTLLDDAERNNPLDLVARGEPPAEISPEVRVWFDPYVQDTFGEVGAIIHEQTLDYRSSRMFLAVQDVPVPANVVLFEGPVFDGMDALNLELVFKEVDQDRRLGVDEAVVGPAAEQLRWSGAIPLVAGSVVVEGPKARAELVVTVVTLF
jgi:hypothetical protein